MWRRIIWQPSGGYWLFYCSAIYFTVAMYSIYVEKFAPVELIQMVWIGVLSLPLVFAPLGRYLNMTPLWVRKEQAMSDNVYSLPDVSQPARPAAPPMPPAKTAPAKEEEHYRVGVTSDGRTTLTLMGSSNSFMTLTMGRGACEQLIKLLEATFTDEE
jgi:hypothetical protein